MKWLCLEFAVSRAPLPRIVDLGAQPFLHPVSATRSDGAMVRQRALIALLLVLGTPACAQRSDWIEGTLVTMDVSGVWRGRLLSGIQGDMELSLTQRGARVTGDALVRATKITIEGTVRGDGFSFN